MTRLPGQISMDIIPDTPPAARLLVAAAIYDNSGNGGRGNSAETSEGGDRKRDAQVTGNSVIDMSMQWDNPT